MARTPAIPMDNPFHGSFEAEGAVYQYHAVIAGSDDHQVTEMDSAGGAADGLAISGVAQHDALDEESVKVVYFGITWGYASGVVERDNPVAAIQSDTASINGRFIVATAVPDGMMLSGIALEDAAAGEKFKLFLLRNIQVAAV